MVCCALLGFQYNTLRKRYSSDRESQKRPTRNIFFLTSLKSCNVQTKIDERMQCNNKTLTQITFERSSFKQHFHNYIFKTKGYYLGVLLVGLRGEEVQDSLLVLSKLEKLKIRRKNLTFTPKIPAQITCERERYGYFRSDFCSHFESLRQANDNF